MYWRIHRIHQRIHQWIRLNKLYKLIETFQVFKFVFDFLSKNRKFFKQVARREYWLKCNMLIINEFVLASSTN